MHTGCLLIALATVGVETGWQPLDRGGLEYIIQIEPSLLDALRSGEAITSEIPPAVEGVRRYRIVVGRDPVPRVGANRSPLPAGPAPDPPQASTGNRPAAAAEPARYPGMESAPLVQAEHTGDPSIAPALPPPPAEDERPQIDPRLPAPPDSQFEDHTHKADGTHKTDQQPSVTLPGNHDRPPASERPSAGVAFPDLPRGGVPLSGETAPVGERQATPPAFTRPGRPDGPPPQHDAGTAPAGKKPDPHMKKPAHQAEHVPPKASPAEPIAETPDRRAADSASPATASKPWMPLFFTLIALFASIGGNVYLGWIAWDSRQHYRQIAQR
ncbi:MAG: hypothetical protein ACC645_06825 [Pirellulales bacterium]